MGPEARWSGGSEVFLALAKSRGLLGGVMQWRSSFSPAGAAVTLLAVVVAGWAVWARKERVDITKGLPGQWRSEKRVIDLHMHIDGTPERFDRAVRIMDKAGVGIGVHLSGGTVTPEKDGKSAFEK